MIGAIVQARLSSSRLPGKVLKSIAGQPMLALQLERIKRIRGVDKIIVATSDREEDQAIAALCEELGIDCYQGSLDDVLDRFYQCAKQFQLSHVIRLTGDCPILDPEIVSRLIDYYREGQFDYCNNFEACTYPDGLDCEIFSFAVLEQAWQQAQKPSEREHVTPFIRHHDGYKKGEIKSDQDISHLRWTVDNPEDFELITQIYQQLYPDNPLFVTADVLKLIKQQPHLATINTHIVRNEGMLKSLEQDKQI